MWRHAHPRVAMVAMGLLTAGVALADPPTGTDILPEMKSEGRVGTYRPGDVLPEDHKGLEASPEGSSSYLYTSAATLRMGEVKVSRLRIILKDERIQTLEIRAWGDKDRPDELHDLTDMLCADSGPVERMTGSPLGTPPEDGDWDPVFITKGTCSGKMADFDFWLKEEHSSSRSDRVGSTTLVISISLPPEPAEDAAP